MAIELRNGRDEDFPAITELDGASFGFSYTEQDLEDARLDVDPSRFVLACDGARIVGISADILFDLTLPGNTQVPVAGLSWVSVDVVHRRRGILRSIVQRQLQEEAAAGLTASILLAAEAGIYGRYGFGAATALRRTRVRRRAAILSTPRSTTDVSVSRIAPGQVRTVLPALYERWRRTMPGAVDRAEGRWNLELLDRESRRGGKSGLFHLAHPDGYVSYRIAEDWADGQPNHTLHIVDYVMLTAEAHAALWQVLLAMDLVGTIESNWIPLDDPLPHLLTDPRAVGTAEVIDGLWVRPLDVAALLSARTYAVEIDVVLGVRDALLGDARYRLQGGPDGASCVPADAGADVELGIAALGAVSLGGTRLAALAGGGQVQADEPRTLSRLDRAFLGEREPQHGTNF